MRNIISLFSGVIIILFGILVGSQSFRNYFTTNNTQTFISSSEIKKLNDERSVTNQTPTISGEPVSILIPSVNIDDKVDPGIYNPITQTWSLSLNDAEYATVTPQPNNKEGNTFIYGHNRWAVFYKLLKINIGEEAIVNTSNHHTFTYQLVSEEIIPPNNLSVFSYHGPPILTLQTCSGLFYQNRQFFVFKLVNVA